MKLLIKIALWCIARQPDKLYVGWGATKEGVIAGIVEENIDKPVVSIVPNDPGK